MQDLCEKNDWKRHTKSPIIWRELVNRGGKGMYLGDGNDFQEYAREYYGLLSELNSDDLRKIGSENLATYHLIADENRKIQESIRPFNLTISNPESPIVYYIINEIANGAIFGDQNEISLKLYSQSPSSNLDGIRMEIEDLASDKLRGIGIVSSGREAFANCDFAILLDELLDDNTNKQNPYVNLAREIDEHAAISCKCLITPFRSQSEIYALVNIFSQHLKRIDAKKNLIGNSLHDQMRAKAVLARRLKVSPGFIKNVFLIGQSVNDSFYIDLLHGQVTDYDGAVWARVNTHWLSLVSMVADKDWMRKDFLNQLHERGLISFSCLDSNYI